MNTLSINGVMRALGTGLVALALASCGGGSGSTNRAPQLTSIDDIVAQANQPTAGIAITVRDDAVGRVAVTAGADDPDLVPPTGVAVTGNAANRTLVLTPTPGALGTTRVTVRARDPQGLEDVVTFSLTIEPEQVQLSDFVRAVFQDDPDAAPRDLNSRVFTADENDDFTDLLGEG